METETEPPPESLISRLNRAFGPLAGGVILDCVDVLTFGPIGMFGGFLLGGAAGWWIASGYEFQPKTRWLVVLLAMIYTAIPFTEPLPLATGISAIQRFRRNRKPADP